MVWVRDRTSGEVVWRPVEAVDPGVGAGEHAGEWGARTEPVVATCPVCGSVMVEHVVDRSTSNSRLECPVEHVRDYERDPDSAYSMLAMPRQARGGEAAAGEVSDEADA